MLTLISSNFQFTFVTLHVGEFLTQYEKVNNQPTGVWKLFCYLTKGVHVPAAIKTQPHGSRSLQPRK